MKITLSLETRRELLALAIERAAPEHCQDRDSWGVEGNNVLLFFSGRYDLTEICALQAELARVQAAFTTALSEALFGEGFITPRREA